MDLKHKADAGILMSDGMYSVHINCLLTHHI